MTPQLARRILLAALGLGVAANVLFKEADSWRAGFTLWVFLVLGVAWIVQRTSTAHIEDQRERQLLFGAAGFFALLLVLRDAPSLYAVDFFAFVVVLFLVAWRAGGRTLSQLEPRDAVIGVASAVTAGIGGAPMLALRDADVGSLEESQRRSYRGFGIGALAAAPVLLVVALLLGEADPLFAGFLEETGALLNGTVASNVLFIGAASWVTAGALRGSLVPVGVNHSTFRGQLQLAFPTFAPLLGGLALLLSAWIGLQVRTLFGGSAYVAETAGVTVANYARAGFFELIVIAGIVLASLLVVDDLLDRNEGKDRASFRTLGLVLIALVGAVLVSAVLRLGLYLKFYGLTDERVLALAVLVWVALVLAWFAMTVLRGGRARFAPGVLVLSLIWVGAFNVVNPERRIVETNVRRAERGMDFDIAYHAKLSGDAVPTLLRLADRLGAPRAAELRSALAAQWATRAVERADWRRWSFPYRSAVRRMEE